MNLGLWEQIATEVSKKIGVLYTSRNNFAYKIFNDGPRKIVAIEQNPNTGTNWAKLAKEGHEVVQFRQGSLSGDYVAVSVDGEVKSY